MPKNNQSKNFSRYSRLFKAGDKSIERLHRDHKELSTKINQSGENEDLTNKNKYRQAKKTPPTSNFPAGIN